MEAALEAGAQHLTSDEIAERFVGKTVTFLPGDKEFLVHYGEENRLAGEMVGGEWSDTGYYAVTNADSICVSWKTLDEGRLRCFSVLVVDDVVKKFNPDGSLAGDIVDFQSGATF